MRNIKLIIEYDGTKYHGWQKQPNGITIQQVLEQTILKITNENINITGSGRTDAGVHAIGQVANFKTNSRISEENFQKAINTLLPYDIVIVSAKEVDADFHSQYNALSKTYLYKTINRPYRSALLKQRAWYMPYSLDLKNMATAAKHLIGKHDFKIFAKSGSNIKTTTREVYETDFEHSKDGIIEFTIRSNGFLKGMVRLIMGTLVNVGKGNLTEYEFKLMINNGTKNKYIKSAPAHGLYLAKVTYNC